MSTEPQPPADPAAEAATLGACLIEPAMIPLVGAIVRPEDFADSRNQTIFRALLLVESSGRAVDLVSVCDQLRRMPIGIRNDARLVSELVSVGDRQRIYELAEGVVSVSGAEGHARIVAEHAARRRVIDAAADVTRRAYGGASLADLASRAAAVAEAATGACAAQSRDLGHDLQDLSDALAEELPDRVTSTGFADLDRLLAGGHRGGELAIEAARPAVGKTSKALRTARLVAETAPAVFVSLEMPRAQLVQRLVSAESGVPLHSLRSRQLGTRDHHAINRALEALRALKPRLRVLDLRDLAAGRGQRPSLATLRGALLREKARAGGALGLVTIDYLQLVRADRDREVREQEVSEVARGLKELALELDAPVQALAQLNRAIERRGEDAEPQLSDLRESGEIEQAADVVSFLARPKQAPGVLRVTVAKQRNGPTGTVDLLWSGDCARPGDLVREHDGNVVPMHRPGVARARPEVAPENDHEVGS